MAERYQHNEEDRGRDWRDRSRESDYGDQQRQRQHEPRWAGGEAEGWRRPEGSRDEWQQSGTGQRYGRGSYDRDRYPDENYGARAYGRGGMRPEWSDERRGNWERETGFAHGAPDDADRYGGGGWGPDFGARREFSRGGGYRGYEGRGERWSGSPGRHAYGQEDWRQIGWRPYGREGEWTDDRSQERSESSSFAGRGPRDYKRSDDRIREDISDRLTDDPRVDASEISVQVKEGEVTLAGTVESRDQKRRAEDVAESVSGVREVSNELRVNRESHIAGADRGRAPQQPGQQGQAAPQRHGQPQTPRDRVITS